MIRRKESDDGESLDHNINKQAPRPEVAYDFEGQEIVVAQAQRKGKLVRLEIRFEALGIRRELGHRWYLLNHGISTAILLAADCEEERIEELRNGDMLSLVRTQEFHPEAIFGRREYATAAVLRGDEVLYKSRGFDVDAYRASLYKFPKWNHHLSHVDLRYWVG